MRHKRATFPHNARFLMLKRIVSRIIQEHPSIVQPVPRDAPRNWLDDGWMLLDDARHNALKHEKARIVRESNALMAHFAGKLRIFAPGHYTTTCHNLNGKKLLCHGLSDPNFFAQLCKLEAAYDHTAALEDQQHELNALEAEDWLADVDIDPCYYDNQDN
ncbi:hypothetical protein F4604DRAFT_1927662 [Suillus subluteus]|nr:hypothetical protein F4604DRAFT_1927662 [Suillus subluteus]